MKEIWRDLQDGRRVFCAGFEGDSTRLPLICLPGLSRNHRDFQPLTDRLAGTRPIYCPDMRGRGRSDWARDPDAEYQPQTELDDVIALADALELGRVAVLGVSRGGIQTMLWAARDPARLAGAALVDIGPQIEMDGLAGVIAALRARKTAFADYQQAAQALAWTHGDRFHGLGPQDWLAMARRIFAKAPSGGVAPDYDPELVRVSAEAFENGIPPFWELFDALAQIPTLALRGGESDLLSARTLDAMAARRPQCAAVTVPGRGHPPILDEPESIASIDDWLKKTDES